MWGDRRLCGGRQTSDVVPQTSAEGVRVTRAPVGRRLGAADVWSGVCGATDVGFGLAGICVDLGFNDDCRRLGPADVWDLQTSVSCRRLFWLVWDLQTSVLVGLGPADVCFSCL